MDRKSEGIEFNREAFVAGPPKAAPAGPRLILGLLLVVSVVALGLIAYKVLIANAGTPASADGRVIAQLDQRLSMIEDRLDQLEKDRGRRAAAPAPAAPAPQPAPAAAAERPASPHYQVSNPTPQQRPMPAAPDPATQAKLNNMQQGMSAMQNDANANKEAWQATTDRLADVAGQVGSQHNAMIKSQEQLNQLLARTSLSAIPFELRRGSNKQPVGPVTLTLKATNLRNHRYTICVWVQGSCIELRDKTMYEVVEFFTAKDSAPLEVIATKVDRDVIVGYLEVPREKGGQ
jgi:pyruvate/2-oxoglutarate dehydrogenase complex dihydrolipoamide acyltransferase (E2) component